MRDEEWDNSAESTEEGEGYLRGRDSQVRLRKSRGEGR